MAVLSIFLFPLLPAVVGNSSRTPDFIAFYTAGTILRHEPAGHLYDLKLQREIQKPLAPQGQFLPFFHAPLEAVLFLPFSSLSLARAFLAWSVVNLALVALIFALVPRTD